MDREAAAWIDRLGLADDGDGGYVRAYHAAREPGGARTLISIAYRLIVAARTRRAGCDRLYFHHAGAAVAVRSPGARARLLGPPDGFQVAVAADTAARLEPVGGAWALISEARVPGWCGRDEAAPEISSQDALDASSSEIEGAGIIAGLGLRPHMEGGHFGERWRSAGAVTTARGARSLASTIYYLLSAAAPTGYFHRNTADITHFLHTGGPIVYCTISPAGEWREVVLGRDPAAGQVLTFTCPGGYFKSSHLGQGVEHGLISEVVAPGFDYADHDMADAALFGRLYPQHRARWAAYVR